MESNERISLTTFTTFHNLHLEVFQGEHGYYMTFVDMPPLEQGSSLRVSVNNPGQKCQWPAPGQGMTEAMDNLQKVFDHSTVYVDDPAVSYQYPPGAIYVNGEWYAMGA